MKFYTLKTKIFHDSLDGMDGLGKLLPRVSGVNLASSFREKFSKKEISQTNLIDKTLPELDHFICWEPSLEIEWDWILLDFYGIAFNLDYSPLSISGWLVSRRVKDIIDSQDVIIGTSHIFHPAKLRFKGEYLEYFLLQYIDIKYDEFLIEKTTLDSVLQPYAIGEQVTDLGKINKIRRQIVKNEIVDKMFWEHYQKYSDLFFSRAGRSLIISERMKKLIDQHELTGLEITDFNISKFSFENQKDALGHDKVLNFRG